MNKAKSFDPITLEVMRNAFYSIADEMIVALIRASYSTNIKPSLKFISPVDGIISSRYGKQRYINDQPRSPHLALDIAAAEGTEIIAPAPGKRIMVLEGESIFSGL